MIFYRKSRHDQHPELKSGGKFTHSLIWHHSLIAPLDSVSCGGCGWVGGGGWGSVCSI